VTDLVSQVIVVLILAVVLFRISAPLTWLLLGVTPVVFAVALGFRRLARYVTRQGNRAMANVNAAIQEAVSGIAVAKNFRQERAIYTDFDGVNRQSYQINIRRGLVLSGVFPVLAVLSGIGTAVLLYYGGLSAGQGAISVGAWYLFVSSLDRFWFPVMNIAAFWSQFQAGLSAAERVFALIDAEPAVVQRDSKPVKRLRGEIVFDQVGFEYAAEETVLRSFSLRIAAGENVALVGHSHAGKTSLVAAMLHVAGSTERLGRVDDGSTVTDHDEEEIARGMTISTGLAWAEWQKNKINLLDAPGFNMFVHEAKIALAVPAESALVVVDGVSGVEVITERVWAYADEFQLPRAIVATRMDRDRADAGRLLDSLTEAFGRAVIPVQLPIGSEKTFGGVVDLVKMKAYTCELGGDGRCSCGIGSLGNCGEPAPDFEKSAHIGYLLVARMGDLDGSCVVDESCVTGDYHLRLSIFGPNGLHNDPDPVDQLVAGYVAELASGATLKVRPCPRRAVGPDLYALFHGMDGRVGRIHAAHLRARGHRARELPCGIERRPPVDPVEREWMQRVLAAAERV